MHSETLKRLILCIAACSLGITLLVSTVIRHTTRTVYVRDPRLASLPGVRTLDPNAELFEIEQREPNRTVIHWRKIDVHVVGGGRVMMREGADNVQVFGELPGGKVYPVVIDTANPGVAAVTSTIVRDAGLEVYPFEDPGGSRGGVCLVPTLKMGDVTIANLACECWLGHYEQRVLGRATWIERKLNIGLGLLKRFGQVRIDSVDEEVRFSSGDFQPDEPNDWRSYPMFIDHDGNRGERLVVTIPIDGRIVNVGLDTGAGPGLILTEKKRAEILPTARILRHKTDQMATPGGHMRCRKMSLETLSIAGMVLTQTPVHVTEDNNPFGSDHLVLGMGYLKDTVIVLDFKHNLLWIRNRPPAHP